MYEFSPGECQRRIEMLKEVLAEGQKRGPDFTCDCREAARPRQEELIDRIRAGDSSGMDELLEFYGGCINAWAKDLCHTPAARAVFRAELAATLLIDAHELTDPDFSNQLHNAATQVAIAQHQHVLEWHQQTAEREVELFIRANAATTGERALEQAAPESTDR